MKKLLGIMVLGLLWCNVSLTEISTPVPSNLITKIASATSFTSKTNNNHNLSNLNKLTSSALSVPDLKKIVAIDAAKLGLKVDEEALEYLTSDSAERDMSREYYTTGDAEGWDFGNVPNKTPDTYVYDTGLVALAQDSNYADAGIFSDAAGAQKGQMKVYLEFKRRIMWTEIISHMTLSGKSQVTSNPTLEVESLETFPVVSDNYYFVKDDGTAYFPGFDPGRDISIMNSGTSIKNTDDDSLNFENAIEGETDENVIDRRVLNHNTDDGAIDHNSSTVSWGGTAIFGDFGLVTVGADSSNTISFEAANCKASCTDTAYAQSVERYTVTVTGVTATKAD